MRALSLKDQEKFTSPWAVTDLDEEKFEKTISYLGRLLRDDIQLQALFHMLVMLSPCSANSPKIQVRKTGLLVQKKSMVFSMNKTILIMETLLYVIIKRTLFCYSLVSQTIIFSAQQVPDICPERGCQPDVQIFVYQHQHALQQDRPPG